MHFTVPRAGVAKLLQHADKEDRPEACPAGGDRLSPAQGRFLALSSRYPSRSRPHNHVGSRSLTSTLGGAEAPKLPEQPDEEADEDFQVPELTEEIIAILLNGISDKVTFGWVV